MQRFDDGAWQLWDAMSLGCRQLVVRLAQTSDPTKVKTLKAQISERLERELGVRYAREEER